MAQEFVRIVGDLYTKYESLLTLMRASVPSMWQSSTYYSVNKMVRYGGKLYISKSNHTTGVTFDPTLYDTLNASGLSAAETSFNDTVLQSGAVNIQEALNYLKTSVSNGKAIIATSITDKGGVAEGSDTFAALAAAINALAMDGGNPFQTNTKISVANGGSQVINFNTARPVETLCYSVLEFVPGSTSNVYSSSFDNTDQTNFSFDGQFVEFSGGVMKQRTVYDYNLTSQGALGDGVHYLSDAITVTDFSTLGKAELNGPMTSISLYGVSQPQYVEADGDISLASIEALNGITLTANVHANSDLRLIMSFDLGVTWKSYHSGSWVTVNELDDADIIAKGLTVSEANALTKSQLEAGRGSSTTVRFGYWLNASSYSAPAETDALTLSVELKGSFNVANTSNYSASYNVLTGVLTITFTNGGIFTFNWVG